LQITQKYLGNGEDARLFIKKARMKTILLLLLVLSFAEVGYTQDAVNLTPDSLLNLIEKNQETPAQVDILNLIAESYSGQSIILKRDSALGYSIRAAELAVKIGYKPGQAEAYYDLGRYYIAVENKPAEATEYLLNGLELFSEISDEIGMSKCYMQLGLISYMLEYYEDAVVNFELSLGFDDNDFSTYLMALSYTELDSIGQAKKYFSKAIKTYQQSNSGYRLSECYLYLGKLYLKTSSLDSAFYYINKSIERGGSTKRNYPLARPYAFLSEVYYESGDLDQAIYYGESSLELEESMQNSRDEISTMQSSKVLAKAYEDKGNYERAHYYLKMFNTANEKFNAGSLKQKVADMKSLFEFEQEMNLQKIRQQKDRVLADAEISTQRIIRNSVLLGLILLLVLLILVYNRYKIKRDSTEALLEMNEIITVEKQRSDELLLNILPEDVAEELKSKGAADAREYEIVSILFSDFAEFTRKSELFSPRELVAEIGACFEAFDGIMEKYGVEKIKTIGDSYMAAGGLSGHSANFIKNTVDAALAMQEFISLRKNEMDTKDIPAFEMRLGIHAGPVVAGIVGVKKFQYDLWGDTVNTASRIESNGEAGKVNISKAAYDAIKDEQGYIFKSRGKVNTKGKGDVEMWFVSRVG
jgi:class 3 adenylate cyclase